MSLQRNLPVLQLSSARVVVDSSLHFVSSSCQSASSISVSNSQQKVLTMPRTYVNYSIMHIPVHKVGVEKQKQWVNQCSLISLLWRN